MPELPEVETVRTGLQRLLKNKTIESVFTDNPKSFPNADTDVQAFLIGAKVESVERRAKVLIINLSSGYSLVIHLKMTGQLVYVGSERFGAGHPNDSLVNKLPDRSTHVTFKFTDQTNLYFNDQRKFGWVRLIPTVEIPNMNFMKKLGPEPLSADFTDKLFISQSMRRKNSRIKTVLLDQTVLAGIGNIYADESLWAAKIHPETKVIQISSTKLKTLHREIIAVLRLSIEKGGSTDRNYVNAEGKRGSYIDFAKVFRKEGSPCQRCGRPIVKTRVAGRGTHLCTFCQRKPR